MDYSAVGQTTHLASRMEQMAEPGSILATADTVTLVEGYIEAVSLGPLSVRGMQTLVDAYVVTGTGATRGAMEVAAARGLTSFVGREGELALLDSAMRSAAGGRGQLVGVVGERGVGKSRLFHEFTRAERMPGWRIVKTRAFSYDKSTAYRPVIDLLRAYFEVHERGDRQEVRDKIVGHVLALDKELAVIVPALLSLFDVPVEDPQWQSLAPLQRREQTMDAVRRLLLRESQGETLRVPASVEAVLAARIDRLAPGDKALLQASAVIGENVPVALLQTVAEMSEPDLRDALARLRAAEFLYDISLLQEPYYVFKHGLTRRVAYHSLLRQQQRRLHARIVEAIERLYPERLSEHVERLARHASDAELWDRAARYLRQAGTKAFARSANREAVVWFEQALTAIEHLPESRELREQAIDLRFELRNALQPLGEFGSIRERLYEAEALAAALPDQTRLGRVAAYLADYFRLTGDQDQAIQWGKRALAIASEIGDLGLQIVATTWLGLIYFARAEYGQAVALLRQNLRLLVGERAGQRFGMPQPPAIHSRTCLAWCLSELGEFSDAIALGEEAVAMVGSSDHPLSRAVAHAGLGWAYLRRGKADQAIAALEQGLEAVRAGNSPLWFPRLASALGCAYGLAGRPTEAVALTEAAVARGAAMTLMGGHSLLLAYLSEAYLLAGRHDDARQSAEQALALARAHKEAGYEGWALRLLAEIALASDTPDATRAIEHGREALTLAEELGMRPLMAHCHLVLGRALAQGTDPAAARRHLAAASQLLGEMGMQAWLEQARGVLARLT